MALVATTAPAQAATLPTPTVTSVASPAKLHSGIYITLRISYRCAPASFLRYLNVYVSQASNGLVWRAQTDYYPRPCTGSVQTSTVNAFQATGQPVWHTGYATVVTQLSTVDPGSNGEFRPSNILTKRVRVTR